MVTIRLQRRGGKKEPFYHVEPTAAAPAVARAGWFFNLVAGGNSEELRLDLRASITGPAWAPSLRIAKAADQGATARSVGWCGLSRGHAPRMTARLAQSPRCGARPGQDRTACGLGQGQFLH
jgi:hypothetical protein